MSTVELIVHCGGVYYGVRPLADGHWQVVYSKFGGPWLDSGTFPSREDAIDHAYRYCRP